MIRSYSIPSHLSPESALSTVESLFSTFGYRWAEINLESHSIEVSAAPIVFRVVESAVKYELHERKGCACPACIHAMEVSYDRC